MDLLLRDTRICKDCRGDDVPARLREVQLGSPFKVQVIRQIRAAPHFERTLHLRFRHLRERGE